MYLAVIVFPKSILVNRHIEQQEKVGFFTNSEVVFGISVHETFAFSVSLSIWKEK